MVVAVVIIIRAIVIVSRRANAYSDTARSRIETNLCRGRQSCADRDRRHKRNSKLTHDCPLCWSHYQLTFSREGSFRLFRVGTSGILTQIVPRALRRIAKHMSALAPKSGHRLSAPRRPLGVVNRTRLHCTITLLARVRHVYGSNLVGSTLSPPSFIGEPSKRLHRNSMNLRLVMGAV
jgi:hypothetical protein